METKRDYYEVLGVNREAEEGAIKKAYRKLAKKYHPDTNAGNAQAEQRFKEITEAYTVLSDPKKRKLYDQFGHAAFDGSGPQEGAYYRNAGNTGNGGYREYHFEGGDMDDIFGDILVILFMERIVEDLESVDLAVENFPAEGLMWKQMSL